MSTISYSTTCGTGESRICTTRAKVGRLFYGALLDPFLCPPAAHPDRVAGNFRALPRTAGRAPVGEEVVPELGRDVQLVPPPRSWPACPLGAVWWSLSPGASRRDAVRAARTGETVAAAFERLPLRVQHWACPPSQVRSEALASST